MAELNLVQRTLHWAPLLFALAGVSCFMGGCGASDSHGANRREKADIVYTDKPATTRPAAKIIKSGGPAEVAAKPREGSAPFAAATNATSPTQPADPRAVMAVLRKGRISTVDRTSSLPALGRTALLKSIQRIGGDSAILFGTPDGCEFLAIGFSDEKALEVLLDAPPHMLLWQNIVLAPVSPMTSTWELIASAVEHDGGRRINSRARECQATLEMLHALRSIIAQFATKEGSQPDFANAQWTTLQQAKLVAAAPRNPLAHPDAADRVEVVGAPGIDGESTNPRKAGWLWNSHDKQLYAAGYDDDTLARLAQAAPGGKHYIAMPAEHVSLRLQLMRVAVVTIKSPPNGRSFKKNNYPSLPELVDHLRARGPVPENPMNNSTEIQQLDWNQKIPPVKGSAGWNYDPKFGKIWANTNVMRENEL